MASIARTMAVTIPREIAIETIMTTALGRYSKSNTIFRLNFVVFFFFFFQF